MNCPACDSVLCGCVNQLWPYPPMPARINISSGEDAMIDHYEIIDKQVERCIIGYEAAYIFNAESSVLRLLS